MTVKATPIELPRGCSDGTVVLRGLRRDDAAPYAAAFVSDRDLGRLLGIETDPDIVVVRRRIEEQARAARSATGAQLAIADPATDAFLGTVILHTLHWEHDRCEIGFWLVAEARGRGLGTAAVTMALGWIFDTLGFARVEITTTPDNAAVRGLAGKLGFEDEGTLRRRNVERGRRTDIVCLGLLRESWNG